MIDAGRHTIVPADVSCFVDLAIGPFCSIASGLKIVSGQHPGVEHPRVVSNFPFAEWEWGEYPPSRHTGQVTIEADVWIGQDVSILDGVRVGAGATIAANAVVTRNVSPYAMVAGNPAREKKRRFDSGTIRRLMEIAWWDWPDEEIKAALPEMADIDRFLSEHGP